MSWLCVLHLGAPGALAVTFPSRLPEKLARELYEAGMVASQARTPASQPRTPDPERWRRWGGAPAERQQAALRAVVAALSEARAPVDLAACILTIGIIESGNNPDAENPRSTACGLFQLIDARWRVHHPVRALCFDPELHARAAVRDLLDTYRTLVAGSVEPLRGRDRVIEACKRLYALHYHGIASPDALRGGAPEVQALVESYLPVTWKLHEVLRRAVPTQVKRPTTKTRRPPARARTRKTLRRT